MALGKAITPYGSELFQGPLGVIKVGFAGWDLGKTTDGSSLSPDTDIKDIMYQQNGTKAADHVMTGVDWMLSTVFGEISTKLLTLVAPYLVASSGSAGADSGYFKGDLNESFLDNYAGVLKIAPMIGFAPSDVEENIMYFYQAIPLINAELVNWGADVQRNLPVDWRIKVKVMTAAESSTVTSAFGYWGDPSSEDLPAVTWPDLEGPYPVSANASAATTVAITLSENATEISGVTTENQVVVKVDDLFVVPTASAYATNVLTLTLPAASITTGQTVLVFIAASTFEDASSNANSAWNEFPVTNSV